MLTSSSISQFKLILSKELKEAFSYIFKLAICQYILSKNKISSDSHVGLEFDYYSCMGHGVIVDEDNIKDHLSCDITGEMFVIKSYKKGLVQGMVSAPLVRKMNEKKELERWEKNQVKEKAKRIRDQERFEHQIPSGDIVINLLTMEMPA